MPRAGTKAARRGRQDNIGFHDLEYRGEDVDVIRLVVQIVFLSFFYWFILSVVRAMERDMANQRKEDA